MQGRMLSRSLAISARKAVSEAVRSYACEEISQEVPAFRTAWDTASRIPGWLAEINAAAFWTYIAETQPKQVVEIGSYLGRSTVLIGLALREYCEKGVLTTVDPHTGDKQQRAALAGQLLPTADLFTHHVSACSLQETVRAKIKPSSDAAREWVGEPIDLLYIDGWHSYDAVLADACEWGHFLGDSGCVCFDDYLNYDDVRSAAIEAAARLGLVHYGNVWRQAWYGRPGRQPASLTTLFRATKWLGVLS